jgi:2-polyprenyl-3-methyl-5-hydroxy-6-metoxy-1,4-benzoquinol methylase
MNITFEHILCPLCSNRQNTPFFSGPDRVHGVPGTFVVVRCSNCGLCYQNPRPTSESFAAIYPAEYGPYQAFNIEQGSLHPDLAMACNLVARTQPHGGKLLDIGCGPGLFLRAMRRQHPTWQLAGIEPDPQAALLAQSHGLDVQQATAEVAILSNATWDAITLWNVIEHLPDPRGMLQRIAGLLRPGGQLYVAAPIYNSWDARIFGKYWTGWELPRHFYAFNTQSLTQLLNSAGFQVTATQCINGRSYGFTASLRLLIQERVKRFALRRLGEAITYSRPLALVISPYTALATAARRCTVLTVVAHLV